MRILLVDDDTSIRIMLTKILEDIGHEVATACDGMEALDVLKSGGYHLVVSDIFMPRMTGIELLRHIKDSEKLKVIEVVLVTAFGEVQSAVEAMRGGAYDYLLKPVNIKELSIIVNRLEEYLNLKEQNARLTSDFNSEVEKATIPLKERLTNLEEAYSKLAGMKNIGVFSQKMKQVYEQGLRLHDNPDINVLIEGETGTGKEVLARYIHFGTDMATAPFVAVNCASLTPSLFESELFGYEAGAFTGGDPKGKPGKLELAEGGSLFLDEIAELSTEYQAKLLRVMQEREYYRVGGLKKHACNVRFICATNRNVIESVASRDFREDLYYRLSVGYLKLPSLRERRDEIMPLAELFLSEIKERKGTNFSVFSNEARLALERHEWQGNVRELKNVIERIVLLCDGTTIDGNHIKTGMNNHYTKNNIPDETSAVDAPSLSDGLAEFDLNGWTLDIVKQALELHHWNKTQTARFLKITRNELYTHLKHLEGK